MVYNNILEAMGGTPVIKLNKIVDNRYWKRVKYKKVLKNELGDVSG